MSLGPFFRSPFTDMTGTVINHQTYGKCAEFEMNMMDCLEAYGMNRGQTKCKDLMEDFQECVGMRKQMLRMVVSIFVLRCLLYVLKNVVCDVDLRPNYYTGHA